MTRMAGMSMSLGMLIALVSLSVFSGFQKAYEHSILDFNSHIILSSQGAFTPIHEVQSALHTLTVTPEEILTWKRYRSLWPFLKKIPFFNNSQMAVLENKGITRFTPFIFREGLALLPKETATITLKGIESSQLTAAHPLRIHFINERQAFPEEAPGVSVPPILLGKALLMRAFPEKIPVNSKIRILIPKERPADPSIRLKDYVQEFQVVGTFESGLYEFDSQFALTSIPVIQSVFKTTEPYSGFDIFLDDPLKAPTMARLLEAKLDHFQAVSWDELNESFFQGLRLEKTLFVVIMLLVILIAASNIMGLIFILVLNRSREIKILQSLGASRKKIRSIFTQQCFFLSGISIIAATVGSLLILGSLEYFQWLSVDATVYYIEKIPVSWPLGLWSFMTLSFLGMVFLLSRMAVGMVFWRK